MTLDGALINSGESGFFVALIARQTVRRMAGEKPRPSPNFFGNVTYCAINKFVIRALIAAFCCGWTFYINSLCFEDWYLIDHPRRFLIH